MTPLRRLLFRLEPERAHHVTLKLLELAGALPPLRSGLRRIFSYESPALSTPALGLSFSNPVGLAAGYDKDGLAMHGLACLGFGHLELGTVTLEPQSGNPRPRIFRLVEDQALINRMGFPNLGVASLLKRLRNRPSDVVLGINIGKSVDTPIEEAGRDYLRLMELVYTAADYLAVNISSPNTIGLRQLQGKWYLERLLRDLGSARAELESETGVRRPILVKLAPDLTEAELDDATDSILRSAMDGVIIANTTISRQGLRSSRRVEGGGMSGLPLFEPSTEMIRRVSSRANGTLPIIGVGGVFGPDEARAKLESGATLVQLFTGLVYRGPGIVRKILKHLD